MRSDSIFYKLFTLFPRSFFELVGQSGEDARMYRFKSVEVKQTAFRVLLQKRRDSGEMVV
ncbi:MAG: DUF2887 domain-containing protein [Cyanobacteria bacterium P01_F01_bin.53]